MHRHSRSLIVRVLPAAAALAAFLAIPLTASAQTGSIPLQSGTACVPNRGDTSKLNYSPSLGIFNDNSTSSGKVFCPVVYSQPEFDGALNGNIEIFVYDQNNGSGKNIDCTLFSLNEDGSVGTSENHKTTGSSPFPQVMGYFFGAVRGGYNFQCTIPPTQNGAQSRVVSYGAQFTD